MKYMTNREKANEIAEFLNQANGSNCLLPCHQAAVAMAEWKDKQFDEEKKDLLGLVKMLQVNENNQTIIEDLIGLLK